MGAGADGTTTRRYTAAVTEWTTQPIARSVGPLAVHRCGNMPAIVLAAAFVGAGREARRAGPAGPA